jgi:hypothetical protein
MLKNEVVVNKEKNFVRYKWANFRLWSKDAKKCVCNCLFYAYVYKDKIRLTKVEFDHVSGSKLTDFVTIKYMRGNFVASRNGGRTSKDKYGRQGSNSFKCVLGHFYLPTWTQRAKLSLTATHYRRLEKIFKEWCESLGHRYSCSRNPENISYILGKLIYPSIQRREYRIKSFNSPEIKTVGSLLRRYLSLKEVIRKLLGSCGKKTYKLVCQKIQQENLTFVLDRLWRFKQIFCLDDIQKILEKDLPIWTGVPIDHGHRQFYLDAINEYVKLFSKKSLFSADSNDFCHTNTFFDSINMWISLNRPEIPSNWTMKVAHDEFADMQRKIRDKPFELNPPEWLLEVDGTVFGPYTVRVPHTSEDLRTWGKVMHNCIYDYGNRMAVGELFLFALEQDGELKYNIEIKTKSIRGATVRGQLEDKVLLPYSEKPTCECRQFVGKCNQPADYEVIDTVFKALPFATQYSHFKPYSPIRNDRRDALIGAQMALQPALIEQEYDANFEARGENIQYPAQRLQPQPAFIRVGDWDEWDE